VSFAEVLDGLLKAPGALGAAFLDPQGQTIAEAGSTEVTEVMSAFQSVWLGELTRASERAELGRLESLAFDFDSRRVLTAEVKHGYFLLVVFDRSGITSMARSRLEDVRELLAAEIG
jgi:predicted regulator of Ras-like GTPase activity (Roadblock/LC7/MglB family)